MAKLRRSRSDSFPIPLAAEVLEVRSLLAAGAAVAHAVHLAEHAALHGDHAAKAPKPPTFSFKGPIGGSLNVPAFSFTHDFAGTLTISKTTLQPNAAFKAKLSVPTVDGLTVKGITGTFTAKITSNTPSGGNTVIQMTPTGGSLKGSVTFGGTTIKTTLLPKNVPFTLTLDSQNHIVSFAGTYVVPSIAGLTAGGDADFSFSAT